MARVYGDVSALLAAALDYLKEKEVALAADHLKAAMKASSDCVYIEAREAVSGVNCQLRAVKRGIERIEGAISSLPEDVRFDAIHSLQPILDEFRNAISGLLIEKRSIARTCIRKAPF